MDVFDLIFPRKCFGCGKEGRYICDLCLAKVKTPKAICPMCERPAIDGMTHSGCKKPLGLDGLTSPWEYDGVIRKAILALKYKYATDVVDELIGYLVTSLKDKLVPNAQCLVPVPLHWYRENFRGFNQSEEIGKLVAKEMGWKFISDLLTRKKSATPQTELKGEERTKNIQGVFSLNPRYQPSVINHWPLVIFDDVYTTGSTLKEACKVLKRGGAKSVWGLTIAR